MTIAPELPPRWRRLYAHIHSLELACPDCGCITTPPRLGRQNPAYDRQGAIWRCPRCGSQYYVGVVLWPAKGRKGARPEDHSLNPGEALELRTQLSGVEARPAYGGKPDGRGAHTADRPVLRVNVRCTCEDAAGCPVHGIVDKSEGEV